MKKCFFCTTALFLLVVQMSYAEKWQAVGARAMAMGGAGVASATGSAQQYYNPALLATESQLHNNDILLNVNVELEATEKLLSAANKIKDLTDKYREVENVINSNSKATADEMKSIVETSFSIPLRAGINKNIANSNSAPEYTTGVGLCGTGFCLELAAGVSTKTTKLDGKKIPANAAVALNLGVLF